MWHKTWRDDKIYQYASLLSGPTSLRDVTSESIPKCSSLTAPWNTHVNEATSKYIKDLQLL